MKKPKRKQKWKKQKRQQKWKTKQNKTKRKQTLKKWKWLVALVRGCLAKAWGESLLGPRDLSLVDWCRTTAGTITGKSWRKFQYAVWTLQTLWCWLTTTNLCLLKSLLSLFSRRFQKDARRTKLRVSAKNKKWRTRFLVCLISPLGKGEETSATQISSVDGISKILCTCEVASATRTSVRMQGILRLDTNSPDFTTICS